MTPFTPADSIWVPDQNGTQFNVMLVVRVGRGTDQDHKRAYLRVNQVPWPTSNL